ncbi:MAG: helix-turn-helix domain-containing protein [Candidatus Heimdallarchaeota archaeon]|nr:helix-turn-helix domain-containing protein [Candidatus Heimdallarchaeota archaeon]
MPNLKKSPEFLIYQQWRELPLVRELDVDIIQKILSQPTRKGILDILSEGISDENCELLNLSKRHVMSANEILEKLQEQGEQITLQNVHFHIKKLQEADLVVQVAVLLENKHNVAYYGRTAKIFTREGTNHLNKEYMQKALGDPLIEYLLEKHPDIKRKELQSNFDTYHERLVRFYNRVVDFINEEFESIDRQDFDLILFINLLNYYSFLDPEYQKINAYFAEKIGLTDFMKT